MKQAEDLPPLSAAQLEIMQLVWQMGEVTVTDVWQKLATERSVARNTVLTLMDRLAKKGWLQKRPVANAHLYQATVTQSRTMGQVAKDFVNQTFDGAADKLLVALLDSGSLSQKEIRSISELIAKHRKK